MLQAQLEVAAYSTIFHPNYSFPSDRTMLQSYPIENQPKGTTIVHPCRLSLPRYGLTLLFNDNRITFFIESDKVGSPRDNPWITPLLYFIIFKTFVDYNAYFSPRPDSATLINEVPEVEKISFNLGKIVEKECEHELGGRKTIGFYHEIEPCLLTLERQDIEDFLIAVNDNLYLLICYYLVGCENSRYFLIEYYKSVETIRNYFDTEKKMKKELRPYGLKWKYCSQLNRYANDQREPLSIGRHAPRKGARLFHVDARRILEKPKSRQIFEKSSAICRSIIETFIRYLKVNAHGEISRYGT